MKNKTIVYYDNMLPPTMIRLVSERMHLDHIIHTACTSPCMGYDDLITLESTAIFDRILFCIEYAVCKNGVIHAQFTKDCLPQDVELFLVKSKWIDLNDVTFVKWTDDPTALYYV